MTETSTGRRRRGPSECGNALTIVVPVERDPSDLAELRALLEDIGKDAARNPIVPLARSESTHFARWVLVEAPDRAPLLAFESNHDGSAEEYVDELLRIGGQGLRDVYAHAVGGAGDLRALLLSHRLEPAAFYRAYPQRSVQDVLFVLEVRSIILAHLDANRRALAHLPAEVIHERVRDMLRERGIDEIRFPPVRTLPLAFLTDALQNLVGPESPARDAARWLLGGIVASPLVLLGGLELAFGASTGHAFGIAALVLLLLAIAAFAGIRIVEGIADTAPRPPPLCDPRLLGAQEDVVVQNQLTHVSCIKAGWFRRLLLRGVFLGIDFFAHRTFTQGNLGGIPSIHFARWVLIEGDRLLFFSNFDGSWDSYLGDFIDKASAGLSSIWSNTAWFPATDVLFWRGAQNAEDFKRWARERQVPTQVWYSAYPRYSVQNIRNAFRSAELATTKLSPERAAAWLAALG